MKQEYIALLAEKVKDTSFEDAKMSSKDSALLGPPSVEFAPYGRLPNSRPRKDARQGTIDQDPDFIDFLESLTNPVSKAPSADQENEGAGKSKVKVTVTPLVQFLKDKKANKGKDNTATAKSSKHGRQDPKENKTAPTSESKATTTPTQVSSPKKRSAQAVKVEQAARDAVKVLNKQAASTNKAAPPPSQPPATPVPKSPNVVPNATANAALADKKRERGNASAAAKILLRDLSLGGNAPGRGGRRGHPANTGRAVAASAVSTPKKEETAHTPSPLATTTSAESAPSTSSITITNTPITSSTSKPPPPQPPTGPAASRAPTNASNQNVSTQSPKPVTPPSTATQAFLKHANPSQGITEPLLEEAFTAFGSVKKVEIDKKKGFAYVDFAEAESLQKAIKASPIKVAQGQVVVLERKTGPKLQARNMRGGPMMGNRGGGLPVGGRGGSIRGRGGYGRGGANMPNPKNLIPSPAAANAAPQVSTAAQAPATAAVANEGSKAQSAASGSAPAPSISSPPAG